MSLLGADVLPLFKGKAHEQKKKDEARQLFSFYDVSPLLSTPFPLLGFLPSCLRPSAQPSHQRGPPHERGEKRVTVGL